MVCTSALSTGSWFPVCEELYGDEIFPPEIAKRLVFQVALCFIGGCSHLWRIILLLSYPAAGQKAPRISYRHTRPSSFHLGGPLEHVLNRHTQLFCCSRLVPEAYRATAAPHAQNVSFDDAVYWQQETCMSNGKSRVSASGAPAVNFLVAFRNKRGNLLHIVISELAQPKKALDVDLTQFVEITLVAHRTP